MVFFKCMVLKRLKFFCERDRFLELVVLGVAIAGDIASARYGEHGEQTQRSNGGLVASSLEFPHSADASLPIVAVILKPPGQSRGRKSAVAWTSVHASVGSARETKWLPRASGNRMAVRKRRDKPARSWGCKSPTVKVAVVPAKGSNKGGQPSAEDLEGRARTEENVVGRDTDRTQWRTGRVPGAGRRAERRLL